MNFLQHDPLFGNIFSSIEHSFYSVFHFPSIIFSFFMFFLFPFFFLLTPFLRTGAGIILKIKVDINLSRKNLLLFNFQSVTI